MIEVYKDDNEKFWEEVENLRSVVDKYQSELCKLRVEVNNVSD